MLFVRTLEKSCTTEHFCDDASNAPHVDLGRVLTASKQQFRGAVPKSNDAIGEAFHLLGPTPRQSPIGDFQRAILAHQQIAGLEVTVDDLLFVHVVNAFEQLKGPRFDVVLGEADFLCLEDTRQIVFGVFEYHEHGFGYCSFGVLCCALFAGNNLFQGNYVIMIQRLENLDLTEGGNRKSVLLLFRVDHLQRCHLVSDLILPQKHRSISPLPNFTNLLIHFYIAQSSARSQQSHVARMAAFDPLIRGFHR
mmetsp:Transcript_14938/g.23183  ORF Transcript_14938/g.23183 Transcript_14938/m.23183 type:complete len:250 (+) Transcript_14938:954-1703(+)